ncbi:hypothetical protein O6H91_03G041400 [Diphasiastrum complanatum]|uniref:Uncharacterized protein n=1 Tax=Diphasiastrum complanatum TaxID=34168 RepID=A0ACC2E607_DIPCM|nr:hypothetical protein O6H91_03G041400 [Diphasiastrum complanatum]
MEFCADLSNLCMVGKIGDTLEALELLDQQGVSLSRNDAYYLLQRCCRTEDLPAGRRIYRLMVRTGLASIAVLGDHLIRLFSMGGCLHEANQVFNSICEPSVYTWSAIIAAHTKLGEGARALDLYNTMQSRGVECDSYTYVAVLNACAQTTTLIQGRLIHDQIIRRGLESDPFVQSGLIDMYAKCGSIDDAIKVFENSPSSDVVVWSSMTSGYAKHGLGQKALDVFKKMKRHGVRPNHVTFVSLLEACGSIPSLAQGRQIHIQIMSYGFESNVVVGNALIDMYIKCGSLAEAHKVFNGLPNHDVVTWGTMITGYAHHGQGHEALELFDKMKQEGVHPDNVLYANILKVCGNMAALGQGRQLHAESLGRGLQSDFLIGNALVDMYSRCGSMDEAHKVFNKMPHRDIVSWGALIGGYARQSDFKMAQQCLNDMQLEGCKPDKVIFLIILAACSRKGLVDEGFQYFKSMSEEYGITPSIEHHTCLVDLLGRAGHLDDAENLLSNMPMPPNLKGWGSLLSSCKTYGDLERGRRCFDQMLRLDSRNASAYVQMSNIFADADMWADAHKVEELRKKAGAWKKPAQAWIEVDNKIHGFDVGDNSHPQSDFIYAKLKVLSRQMKEEGYVPKVELVVKPVSDEDKEDALCGHVEKLAIAYGLVSTPPGTTLRAAKSLRVCTDCHSATKIISKLEKREIFIRDAYRLHHFKDGACSCNDFF